MAGELRRRRTARRLDARDPAAGARDTCRRRRCSRRCSLASSSFFVLEKLVLWRHCHIHDCEVHDGSVFPVLIGDAFHNFVDGAVIAAAVMTSVPLGVSTALAVAAHEIPQEVGDFAILLHAGYSRRGRCCSTCMSGLASAGGAVVALVALKVVPLLLPYCLALAAASFLYVAMADLIPGLHRGRTDAHSMRQILLIAAGVATAFVFVQ